jgi:mRNA interferase YafQ
MKFFYTGRFKRDYKRLIKQDKDIGKLDGVIKKLCNCEVLGVKYKDHKLWGCWNNHRECHIEPDWLLIYRKEKNIIYFERTGSHSDLYK